MLRLTRHDLAIRHAGSVLGLGWVALGPLLILGVYAVVYLVVFHSRVPSLSGPAYVVYIFCGLVPYLSTAEGMSRGTASVVANKAVLNNTVYPIDLTPVQAALSGQATMLVGMPLVIAGSLLTGHAHLTLLALPVVWALMLIWLIGVNWVLGLLNVVVRDLQNLLAVILMIMLVASPFAYTPAMVPHSYRLLLFLNPFAYFVLAYQQVIMLGVLPDLFHTAVLVAMPILTFAFGSWLFAKGKGAVLDYV